jgi:simple sugar transport system ATP-binding protein
MRNMQKDGKYLIIITHKHHEVLEVSDRVAILRKGEYIGDVPTANANQQSLTDMMVGHSVSLNIDRPDPVDPKPRLVIEHLTAYDELGVKRLDDVTFTANSGEVLGIAGVAGSGQKELLESIAGLYPVSEGSILYYDPDVDYGDPANKPKNLVGMDPMSIRKAGIAMSFVPEDRLGMGLVGTMGMTGNMMLRSWRSSKGLFVNRKDPEALANRIWKELEVVTPSTKFPVRRMSGGNVQKVLVGREIAQEPNVLMTAYAVRGLDINTSYTIYNLLTEQKMKGRAVIYVGEDLDVLLELCDRIVVLCGGQVSGVVDGRTITKEEVGLLMTQHRKEGSD